MGEDVDHIEVAQVKAGHIGVVQVEADRIVVVQLEADHIVVVQAAAVHTEAARMGPGRLWEHMLVESDIESAGRIGQAEGVLDMAMGVLRLGVGFQAWEACPESRVVVVTVALPKAVDGALSQNAGLVAVVAWEELALHTVAEAEAMPHGQGEWGLWCRLVGRLDMRR